MALVISPKTGKELRMAFKEAFGSLHHSSSADNLWHRNFRQSTFYVNMNNRDVWLMLTGYSGATVGHAIFEYDKHLRDSDHPSLAFLVGSCFATKQSKLKTGQIVLPTDSYSPDSFEQAIYQCCKLRGQDDPGKPDSALLKKTSSIAAAMGIKAMRARIYSRISPGILASFSKGQELMDRGMWYEFALTQGHRDGFDAAEYETAAFLATCKLLNLPAVAILDVKDRRIASTEDGYLARSYDIKLSALRTSINLIKEVLSSFQEI